jgi:hypothetical protein
MEKGEAGIVGEEIDFGFLVASEHDDVFHHAGLGLAGDFGDLEGVAVKMDGMKIVAGVAETDAVALAFFEVEGGGDRILGHGKSGAVDVPNVEAFVSRIVFGKEHFEGFVG